MVIAHNISALNTYKSLGIAGGASDKSMEKLSSGYRINRAGDDAAGLSISEKMRSQIRGLNQASTNAEHGVSMIQTAEGALNEGHAILQRMRELAVQSATDTNASEDREALQSELEQLSSEINRIGNTTEFNGMKILDGSKAREYNNDGTKAELTITLDAKLTDDTKANVKAGAEIELNGETWVVKADGQKDDQAIVVEQKEASKVAQEASTTAYTENVFGLKAATTQITKAGTDNTEKKDNSVYFHVGANENQVINTEFEDMRAESLGLTVKTVAAGEKDNYTTKMTVNNGTDITGVEYALNISTRKGANNAIEKIDAAIKKVSDERSKYGAIQNRLEYTINNLNTTAENMTAAESTIRDVDMADEMMELTKNNILQQAAQAMLVQANARPQQALQLLQ